MVSKSTRSRAYFTAFSRQLLVLGAVGAALIPAAGVINLDVVAQNPADATATSSAPIGAASRNLSTSATPSQAPQASVVPVGPVTVTGHDISLTSATSAAPVKEHAAQSKVRSVLSDIEPVTGYGIVGLSWAHGETLSKADVSAEIRTQTQGVWTEWQGIDYADNGPDDHSPDAAHGRPGTEEALVGKVDFVQARLSVAQGELPRDLKLTVVDTGTATKTAVEAPAIDTASLDSDSASPEASHPAPANSSHEAIAPASASYALAAGTVTPKPYIYSRAQWGANESYRDPSSLHYFEIHGGFIHHTVNSNNYTAGDVPAIIRGIYYFHTHSRGWSDIGYNFLIDKFGRTWEGRFGGVDRPVVGAHAYGVNDYAFGVAAIGNYDQMQPSPALLKAEGALFAWKLSLSGISAGATRANIAGVVFNSPIQGHRDAAKVDSGNETECPGTYLYAKIPTIRAYAAADQRGWSGRVLRTNIVGAYPSVVARRASDNQVFVLPTGGVSEYGAPVATAVVPGAGKTVVPTPDVTGDGAADLVVVGASGGVMAGHNDGTFGALAAPTTVFAGVTKVIAVGDVNRDGRNDLMGISTTATHSGVVFLGDGRGHFSKRTLSLRLGEPAFFASVGAMTSDGKPDVVTVSGSGAMLRYHGNGAGAFAAGVTVPGTYTGVKALTGFGDFTGDGKNDVAETLTNGATWVLPGDGNGGFGPGIGPYSAPGRMGSVLGAAVLTGHTYPDLVGMTSGRVYIAKHNGRRDLLAPIATGIVLPTAKQIFTVGDWDGDGYVDFMSFDTAGTVKLYRGQGNGRFLAPISMATSKTVWSNIAGVGDVTGDGNPDLQVQSGSALYIVPGRGAGVGFGHSYVAHAAIAGQQAAAGLWDGDGAPDSFFKNGSTLTLWLGDGPGGLYASKSTGLNVGAYNWIAGVSNARGASHPDLFARHSATGSLVVRYGVDLTHGHYLGGGLNAFNLLG